MHARERVRGAQMTYTVVSEVNAIASGIATEEYLPGMASLVQMLESESLTSPIPCSDGVESMA